MDAGVEATQEQLSDALSKNPAPAHGLAGHGEGMDARVEATQERLPDAQQAPSGVLFFFGCLSLYSGHPALRPSGRLRRSHALLRMREHAKRK